MDVSIQAKLLSKLLQFYPKPTGEKREQMLADTLEEGMKPTKPPKKIRTRYEDYENGRVFYANEKDGFSDSCPRISGGSFRNI